MKLGQIQTAVKIPLVTNEGIFDFLKIFGKRKRLSDEEISKMVGNIDNRAIEEYLKKTLLNSDWVKSNLSESKGTPIVSEVAFISGKNVPDPVKLVKVLRGMYGCADNVLKILKSNTELRQKLCKELKGKRGAAANELAESLYEKNKNNLPVIIEKLWMDKGGRNIREAVGYNGKGDGWPCMTNGRNQPEFTGFFSLDAPKGCSIDEVTRSTASEYARVIMDLVKIIQDSASLIRKNRIPYWDILGMDYDTLNHADEIYDGLAAGQDHLATDPMSAVMWTAKILLKEVLKAI